MKSLLFGRDCLANTDTYQPNDCNWKLVTRNSQLICSTVAWP